MARPYRRAHLAGREFLHSIDPKPPFEAGVSNGRFLADQVTHRHIHD